MSVVVLTPLTCTRAFVSRRMSSTAGKLELAPLSTTCSRRKPRSDRLRATSEEGRARTAGMARPVCPVRASRQREWQSQILPTRWQRRVP